MLDATPADQMDTSTVVQWVSSSAAKTAIELAVLWAASRVAETAALTAVYWVVSRVAAKAVSSAGLWAVHSAEQWVATMVVY